MDRSRFDNLTRELATTPSRRRVVKSALGLMLGGSLGAVTIGDSAAAPKGRRPADVCRTNSDCSSNTCGPADRTGRRRCLCAVADQCPQPSDTQYIATCSGDGLCGVDFIGGCFVGGTQIAIPGGASRAIEFFMPGDEVIASDGTTNRVLELERQPLGRRPLYSVNDSGFFFSPEHVFMSDTGWRAINVDIARRDDPTIEVEPLRVGDTIYAMAAVPVYAIAGAGHCTAPAVAEPITVTSLVGQWTEPQTFIYNILLDGDMTYFANGFLVHD